MGLGTIEDDDNDNDDDDDDDDVVAAIAFGGEDEDGDDDDDNVASATASFATASNDDGSSVVATGIDLSCSIFTNDARDASSAFFFACLFKLSFVCSFEAFEIELSCSTLILDKDR